MADGVQNLSSEQVFNKIIACQAWGSVVDNEWKVGHDTLTTIRPSEGLVTYFNYIKDSIPLQSKEEEPDDAKRNEYNKGQRGKRQKFLATITEEGNPGTQFKKELEEMTKTLLLPEYVMNELNAAENKEEADELMKLYEGGSQYLVPSFFKVINHLRTQKLDFDIVFRTFGTDIIDLQKEYNLFCEGKHPSFNGNNGNVLVKMDGSEGGKDYRVTSQFTGFLMRKSDKPEESTMVLGSLDRSVKNEALTEEGNITMTTGIAAIYAKIMECLETRGCVSLQDDFNAWNSNAEKAEFGKPVFIDTANPDIHHIFFDDNAYDEPTSIVDVRDLATGAPMAIAKAWNKYVVNVDTYKAITDTDYFIKAVNQCRENFKAEQTAKIAEKAAEEQAAAAQLEEVKAPDAAEPVQQETNASLDPATGSSEVPSQSTTETPSAPIEEQKTESETAEIPSTSSAERKITYFNSETDSTVTLTSVPLDFNQLKEQIGEESRGIFTYKNAGEDDFIHDQASYDEAWVNCGNHLEICEKARMRV